MAVGFLQALNDPRVVVLCNCRDVNGYVLGFVVMEVGVVVGCVMDQCGSVSIWTFGCVVYALRKSDRDDIVNPEEVPDKVLQSHVYLWCLFAHGG